MNSTYKLLRRGNLKLLFISTLFFIGSPFISVGYIFRFLFSILSFSKEKIIQVWLSYKSLWSFALTVYIAIFAPKKYKPFRSYKGEFENLQWDDFKHRGAYLTENFLIIHKTFSFYVLPKDSIVWIYKHVYNETLYDGKFSHRAIRQYTIVSLILKSVDGKTYTLGLHDQYKYDQTLILEKTFVGNRIDLKDFVAAFPHVVWGYTSEFENIYKQSPHLLLDIAPNFSDESIISLLEDTTIPPGSIRL